MQPVDQLPFDGAAPFMLADRSVPYLRDFVIAERLADAGAANVVFGRKHDLLRMEKTGSLLGGRTEQERAQFPRNYTQTTSGRRLRQAPVRGY